MKKTLLFALLLVSQLFFGQGAPTCDQAYSLCNSLGVSFPNTTGGINGGQMACLGSTPNQSWFSFQAATTGGIFLSISQMTDMGQMTDVDFVCYGPINLQNFNNPCMAITAGVSPADCSYSAAATETVELPTAQAGDYYILLVTNFSDRPGNISINVLPSSTAVIGCAGLHVVSFIDTNLNGVQDASETGFPNGRFSYTDNSTGIEHQISDADSDFIIYNENTDAGINVSYLMPEPYDAYYSITPDTYTNVHTQTGGLMETIYFPVTITQPYNDVSIHSISRRPPQPGFTNVTDIVYRNLGTAPSSGTITFNIGSDQTFEAFSDEVAVTGTTGFEYTYTNLQPFETRTLTVTTLTATDAVPGNITTSTATISTTEEETVTTNNSSALEQTLVASYDPNDISESHGPQINVASFNETEDYLYYTIRFQNMGTASAHFVNIEHLLDNYIDPTTVVMLHSSHNYEMDRIGTMLKWHFQDIQLPTISVNEAGSQGYVYFKAKAYPGITVGDIIPAAASIYFDYNSAVITNTFQTNFVEDVSATDIVTKKAFSLYPNPANSTVNINATQGISAVMLYDISGKTLLSKTVNNDTHVILATDGLAAGTYFVQVTTQNGVTTQKLVKL